MAITRYRPFDFFFSTGKTSICAKLVIGN